MLTTMKGDLVMVGLNTDTPKVLWKGVEVPGVIDISVDNDENRQRVVLVLQEDTLVSELKAAGITVRRADHG